MERQTKPATGHRVGAVCQKGCGLQLQLQSRGDVGEADHCCVEALRALTDALEERSATLEHEARMARLRWNRREQFLLAKMSALHNEAQLAALKYQRRLHQHMVHINSITEQVTGYCKLVLSQHVEVTTLVLVPDLHLAYANREQRQSLTTSDSIKAL
ncbi:hypothetical protein PAMA_019638 [Pampus argenteus]